MGKFDRICFGLATQLREIQFAREAEKRGDSGVDKFYNLMIRQKSRLASARLTPLTLVETEKK